MNRLRRIKKPNAAQGQASGRLECDKSYRLTACRFCQEMIHAYHALIWICLTIMFHDLMSGAVRILNTIFVERIKVKLAEVEAKRIQAQADIIKDRERRKLEAWDRV